MTLYRNAKTALESHTTGTKKLAGDNGWTENPAITGCLVYIPNTEVRERTYVSFSLGAFLSQQIDLAFMAQNTTCHKEEMVGSMLPAFQAMEDISLDNFDAVVRSDADFDTAHMIRRIVVILDIAA